MSVTGPDVLKDTALVHTAANRALNSRDKQCIGQKGLPMFAKLQNYCYEKMNIPDIMHNLSRYDSEYEGSVSYTYVST